MSTISASTTSTTGFKVTSDTTGTLVFQTGASPTTAMTISSSQIISFTNPPTATGGGSVSTNTAYGTSALAANTTAGNQAVFGYQAAYNFASTGTAPITAFGALAAYSINAADPRLTAIGYQALYSNNGGGTYENTAVGWYAARLTTTGSGLVAMGNESLSANTTGSNIVAIGYQALASNTIGAQNTAVGYRAGFSNVSSNNSVFFGDRAGYSNTGAQNTFIGQYSGYSATSGTYNTFVGNSAGNAITTGGKNTILGAYSGNQGGLDIRTASNYIVLSDGDGNPLAYWGIGYTFLPSAYSITTASAANLFVASDGTLRRSTSALKYKQDVRDLEEMDISLLRAVRYKSKSKDDDQTKDHFGLIADEAAEAGFEELVIRDAEGEIEGFQYERLTVVLLKKLQVLESEFKALKGQA